jgi:hypothetical protein
MASKVPDLSGYRKIARTSLFGPSSIDALRQAHRFSVHRPMIETDQAFRGREALLYSAC